MDKRARGKASAEYDTMQYHCFSEKKKIFILVYKSNLFRSKYTLVVYILGKKNVSFVYIFKQRPSRKWLQTDIGK